MAGSIGYSIGKVACLVVMHPISDFYKGSRMRRVAKLALTRILAAGVLASFITNANACTALVITDVNGIGYNAKTMEYAKPIPLMMQYVPAGTKMVSVTPTGSDGMSFVTKYAILGGGLRANSKDHQDAMIEAMNDQGLGLVAKDPIHGQCRNAHSLHLV